MTYNIKIRKEEYVLTALKIVNCIYKLSELELKILVQIINNRYSVLDRSTRSSIRELLNTDKYTFNNYIAKLKNKQILIPKDKHLTINPVIIKLLSDRKFEFNFELE